MVTSVDSKYLLGPDVTGAFAKGAEFVSAQETAELNRQIAAAQNRRAEEELRIQQANLAIRQAAAQRTAAAARRAEQQRQQQQAAGLQFGTGALGILGQTNRGLTQYPTGAVPPQTAPTPALGAPTGGVPSQPSPATAGTPTPGAVTVGAPPPQGPPPPQIKQEVLGTSETREGTVELRPTTPQEVFSRIPALQSAFGAYGSATSRMREVPPQSSRERASVIAGNIDAIRSTLRPKAGLVPGTYNGAQVDEILQFNRLMSTADSWFGSPETRELFDRNPELLRQAAADPIAFYEQYKGGAPVSSQRPGGVFSQYPELRVAYPTYGAATARLKPVPPPPSPDLPVASERRQARERNTALSKNIDAIRSTLRSRLAALDVERSTDWPAGSLGRSLRAKYNQAQINDIRRFTVSVKTADKWLGSSEARKLFDQDPELLRQAAADPIAFYEQYKGAASTPGQRPGVVTTGEVPDQGADQPPGVATGETTPEQAAKAVESRNPKAVEGATPGARQKEPADTVGNVIKAVDAATIAPPNLEALSKTPIKASREVQSADKALKVLEQAVRYYASLLPNNPSLIANLVDSLTRFQAMAAQREAAVGAQAIATLRTTGDSRLLGQLYSRKLGRNVVIQPQPDGTYSFVVDGQTVVSSQPRRDLLDEARRVFEAGYQERIAKSAVSQTEYLRKLAIEQVKANGKIDAALKKQVGYKNIRELSDGSVIFSFTDAQGRSALYTMSPRPQQTGKATDPRSLARWTVEEVPGRSNVPTDWTKGERP